jgi:hypothetical protein
MIAEKRLAGLSERPWKRTGTRNEDKPSRNAAVSEQLMLHIPRPLVADRNARSCRVGCPRQMAAIGQDIDDHALLPQDRFHSPQEAVWQHSAVPLGDVGLDDHSYQTVPLRHGETHASLGLAGRCLTATPSNRDLSRLRFLSRWATIPVNEKGPLCDARRVWR